MLVRICSSDLPMQYSIYFMFFFFYRFLSETGLVSVEHQMREMGLEAKDPLEANKKSE